jgi:SAM-dependent methyltransferase
VAVNRAPYDPIATLYDRHWGYDFSTLARAAFDTHLLPLLPAGSSVLDLCCGTGLILAHLVQRGMQPCGVDESAQMLAIARRAVPDVELLQADMAEFTVAAPVCAIVSFYNSLNHARSLQHLRATVRNVAKHLKPGGHFFFDYVLPEAFEAAWEWSETSDTAEVLYTYEKSSGHATCIINQRDTIRQMSFTPQEILDGLIDAGLSVVSETPMTDSLPKDGRVLMLARKQ